MYPTKDIVKRVAWANLEQTACSTGNSQCHRPCSIDRISLVLMTVTCSILMYEHQKTKGFERRAPQASWQSPTDYCVLWFNVSLLQHKIRSFCSWTWYHSLLLSFSRLARTFSNNCLYLSPGVVNYCCARTWAPCNSSLQAFLNGAIPPWWWVSVHWVW